MFFSVDNNRGNLLIHKEEDSQQQGWYRGQKIDIPENINVCNISQQ